MFHLQMCFIFHLKINPGQTTVSALLNQQLHSSALATDSTLLFDSGFFSFEYLHKHQKGQLIITISLWREDFINEHASLK